MRRRTFIRRSAAGVAAISTWGALPARFVFADDAGAMRISAEFPGGNVKLIGVDGDVVQVAPDLRDTGGKWFYWCFAVTGAAGRTLKFRFPDQQCIGTRGPAISLDGGDTWRWQSEQFKPGVEFTYAFAEDAGEVRFAMTMPYLPANLDAWLKSHAGDANLRVRTLCQSRKGRDVPLLRLGRLDGEPAARVMLTTRHHACETMASFVLEGIMDAVLGDAALEPLRRKVQVVAVPMVDYDGVVDGDQGKNRKPHDHNRDYNAEPIYPEVAAIQKLVRDEFAAGPWISLDLHCPYIRGGKHNECFYQVGKKDADLWAAQQKFGRLVEAAPTGSVPYEQSNDLPHGQAWNTGANFKQGLSCGQWMSRQPNNLMGTSWEFAYATADGAAVNPESCRAFGGGMARAIGQFLGA